MSPPTRLFRAPAMCLCSCPRNLSPPFYAFSRRMRFMRSVPLSVRYSAVNLITQRSASSLLSSTASTSTSSYIYSHSSSSSSRHSNVSGLFQRYSFPLLRAGHRPFHTTQYNLNGKNQQGTTSSVHAEGEQVEGDIKVHGNQSGSEEEKTVTVRIDSRGLRHPRPDGVEEERFMRWPRAENTDAAESEKEGDQDHSSSSSSSFSSSSSLTADDATLEDYLDGIISISGALPIATFMKEALTHPRLGYYMKPRQGSGGDMFGRAGDFTTSPEISQMFGEVLGTLCVDNWIKLGRPKSFNLVEMGPGRGSLMCDILRTGSHFEGFLDAVSVHFIERSTYLQQVQAERLKCVGWQYQDDGEGDNIAQQESLRIADLVAIEERQMLFPEAGRQVLTKSKKYGCNVSWHVNWDELPAGPTLFLGHEFLDALPIHKFECTDQGWRELLVDRAPRTQESVSVEVRRRHEEGKDNDQEEDAESLRGQDNPRFRYVLSPGPTISTQIFRDYLPVAVPGARREICPQALSVAVKVARHIQEHTGNALFIDYGKFGPYEDSLRGILDHKKCSILQSPGEVDISASVDFAALDKAIVTTFMRSGESGEEVETFPSISQKTFLQNIGLDARFTALLRGASEEQAQTLIDAYRRLIDDMGEDYHVYSVSSPGLMRTYMME